MRTRLLRLWLFAALAAGLAPPARAEHPVDFARDVQPLLATTCLRCHGPDAHARKANLRLDSRADAFTVRNGLHIIVPGKSQESELYRRITADDPDERMPPPASGKTLTAGQIALLKRWINQGAPWDDHRWFQPPHRPPLPQVRDRSWPRGAIDYFILATLESAGRTPSPPADRAQLIRRLMLDLTGLPPTPSETDAFVGDPRPDAYERLVDRVLASPNYGEQMALRWLDLARYADSNGYERDHDREIWVYRDWVIDSFNQDMPYDRFTIEQLAGDLLPKPTPEQRIATGFQRNSMLNRENGIDIEEFRVAAVKDRVDTTSAVWLGLTVGCAQCHDHKYDPITQADYYRLYAIFNQDADEVAVADIKGDTSFRSDISPDYPAESPLLHRERPMLASRLASMQTKAGGPSLPGVSNAPLEAAYLKSRLELASKLHSTLVMHKAVRARNTRIQVRGNFRTLGDPVEPGVPAMFHQLPGNAPADRLALARWLVDPQHPLTARVEMNRIWAGHFAEGIVPTLDDFGHRSAAAANAPLLDWLARELIDSGWRLKHMHRLIVTSATYRQSSSSTPTAQSQDPRNELLGFYPRRRLTAEQIRDNALAIGGLLNPEMGGPGVRPYQPNFVTGFRSDWQQSRGPDRFRRGIYTFWQRTSPYASFVTFDAPTREVCWVKRSSTNTPLQALDLLNNPVLTEAAGALACRMLADPVAPLEQRIVRGVRLCVGRRPEAAEVAVLTQLYRNALADYRRLPAATSQIIAAAGCRRPAAVEPAEMAAWILLANTLLNLDETITRE